MAEGCRIGTLESISSFVAVKYIYGTVCVRPYITVQHVCAYVFVCDRVQQREREGDWAFLFINIGERTPEREDAHSEDLGT